MVINQIHIERITFLKAENDAPIAGYLHTPKALQRPFERVKVVARLIEVLRFDGDIKERKDIFDHLKLVLSDLTLVVPFIKPLQTSMFEFLNHMHTVRRIGTGFNFQRYLRTGSGLAMPHSSGERWKMWHCKT